MIIQNSTQHTFSVKAQQTIRTAAASVGVDEVVTKTNKPHDEVDNIFNIFDTQGNYLFSIDTEVDQIFENQYIA